MVNTDYPLNWDDIRREILELDSYRCQNCGNARALHIHHIIPLSQGGRNEVGNLVSLCEECHKVEHPQLDKDTKFQKTSSSVKYRSILRCEQCNKQFSHSTGLYFCPECGTFLKTLTVVEPTQVVESTHTKQTYHYLKYGVPEDDENEYHIDEEL